MIEVLILLIIVAGATYAFFIAQTTDGQAFVINTKTGSTDNLSEV